MKKKLAIGTRFWGTKETNSLELLSKIRNFIEKSMEYGDLILVAINTDEDKINSLKILSSDYSKNNSVKIFEVSPWQKFVPALNAMAYKASVAKMDYLLIQSIEIPPLNRKKIRYLMSHMDEKTISAGVALPEHDFHPGRMMKGNGLTVPWNSCNLWNLEYLMLVGFSFIADAPFDETGKNAGVEEVTTLSEIQSLRPGTIAKLIEIPDIKWENSKDDPEKMARHKIKIRTKIKRAKEQIKRMDLKPPKILHIKYKTDE